MRFQSKSNIADGSYVPIKLNHDFPVSEPDFNVRSSEPAIKPHIHDCLEIGYCYDGSGVFIIEDKILPFKKGDAVLINNREVHITAANPGGMTSWGFINIDQIALLSAYAGPEERCLEADSLCGSNFDNIINCDRYPEICGIIKTIIEETAHRPKGYKSMVRSLVWSLMIKLHRITADLQPEPAVPELHENLKRITPALEYIAENFSKSISMKKLASLCHSSESNFRKLFHKAVGCAPQVYIRKLRMKAAAVLLRNSSRSVLDIAISSGYATLSNFNRQFLDFYSVSPTEWRKNKTEPVRVHENKN